MDIQSALEYLQDTGLLFLSLLFGGFFPFALLTVLDGWLSGLALRRIVAVGGFRLIYLTAWIGVPVHETSHAIAALLGAHHIRRFAPLSPNQKTGQLGILETTYDDKRWWAKWVGNTIIPIAPIFGGTIILLILMQLLSPKFTLFASNQFTPPLPGHIDSLSSWQLYLENFRVQINFFLNELWNPELFANWQSYVICYVMLCVALHISPSSTDWRNFRKPLIFLLLFILIGCFAITPFPSQIPFIHVLLIRVVTRLLPVWIFVSMIVVAATVPIILITQIFTITRNEY